MTALIERVRGIRQSIEAELARHLPPEPSTSVDNPSGSGPLAPGLVAAMRYSTLAGGKRLRPLLCYAAAEAASDPMTQGAPEAQQTTEAALRVGCALELVHTYSLIHDDLPAMDDDHLRRGMPTCHIRFNEAEAILAGDALQALAFELLANQPLPAATCLEMIVRLARAIGWAGMVGGQSFDLALTAMSITEQQVTQAQLEALHAAKTGALLQASVELGAIAAQPADPAIVPACGRIGAHLGLAFQVIDDVLDVSQSTETLGKDAGSDAAQGKTTFINLLGEDGARNYAYELFEQARSELATLPGPTDLLEAAAREVVFRNC